MRPFAWILLTFPAFLLVRGKLAQYVSLATEAKK